MELDVLSLTADGERCEGSDSCTKPVVLVVRGPRATIQLCREHARALSGLVTAALEKNEGEGHFFRPTKSTPRPDDVVRFDIAYDTTRNPRSRTSAFGAAFRSYLKTRNLEILADENLAHFGGALFKSAGVVTADDLLRLERWIKLQQIACTVVFGNSEDGLLVDYEAEIDPWSRFEVDNLTSEDLRAKDIEDL